MTTMQYLENPLITLIASCEVDVFNSSILSSFSILLH